MELIYLVIGIIIGWVMGLFYYRGKSGQRGEESISGQQMMNEQALKLSVADNELKMNKSIIEEITNQLESKQTKIVELEKLLSGAEERIRFFEMKNEENRKALEEMNQRFTKDFELIAGKLLEEKSKKFADQNKNNLDEILKPFQERIKDFEKKVNDVYDIEMRDKISLREEVKKLYELNARISNEAANLTNALKGDNKKQGNWGELILEKVLERSGLVRDVEYKSQVVTSNADGETIKPDFVVFLPDNKHLIIDAKVSLTAYEQMVNAASDEERSMYLKEHVASIKNHVKTLSDKNYYSSGKFTTPDFVLLFMPMESAFSVAIQYDAELFNYAWDRRTVLVSPTTLLATLRTVASLWKIENQNRNALEIAERAGALYDKFEGLMKDLIDVGKKMDDSKSAYEEAMKKLYTGNGNLIRRVEQIKTLGAKTTKQLPPTLVERSMEE
jgi:DNA recombination protein RmuC